MPLIKGGRFVADPWRDLADDEALPAEGKVLVSHKRWLGERATLTQTTLSLGLRLPNDVAPATLAGDIARFDLIVLNFPKFTDGRAYSQARLIRGRLGFRGELRASGDVLRDQLLFMQRCGIDAFAVSARAAAENWLSAFADFDIFYQPSEDRRPSTMQRRLGIV
jgi:uncharacterized protein (DUF934 family)